jgi:hypothetical protein
MVGGRAMKSQIDACVIPNARDGTDRPLCCASVVRDISGTQWRSDPARVYESEGRENLSSRRAPARPAAEELASTR